ncbi:MAG: bifunctional 5,10-methylenetetrahydrofolate dehydrogenase/5,10-methenyltetrahydrofolate cyclohydrolase [Patescibacteria group bacterium]
MSATIFNGKLAAADILTDVRGRVMKLKEAPKLLSFYNPKDSASVLYTRIKKQKAENVGIEFEERPTSLGELRGIGYDEIVEQIVEAGREQSITGVLIQHPTGEYSVEEEDWKRLVNAINPKKDVDGLRADSPFVPATVRAVLVALDFSGIDYKGCKIAVVGATGMVGRPLVRVLRKMGAKVREIDERTRDIWFQTKASDVLISCVGKPNLIHGDMIKKGAVVVDVGSPGGDVNFESAQAVASFITPVPGGIGPLTVASLLKNTVLATEQQV